MREMGSQKGQGRPAANVEATTVPPVLALDAFGFM